MTMPFEPIRPRVVIGGLQLKLCEITGRPVSPGAFGTVSGT